MRLLPSPSRLPRHVQAWVVVGASCLMMGMAFGSLLSVTVFLRPLEAEFGWDRGVTSFAYSSASFMTGLLGIGMGRLADRISPRPILLCGALMMGAAHLLLSRIDSPWQLYLLYGFMVGGLGNGCFIVPLIANVGFWFERHRGVAVGIVMAGQSLGGALVPGLTRLLLEHLAWRDAYLALGTIVLATVVPLALLVRAPPDIAALRAAQGAAGQGVAPISPARLTAILCAGIVACCVCMSIPVVHVYPLAVEAGHTPAQAATVLGVLMSVSIVGRVGIGKVADQVGGIRSLLLASGLQTALIFWFSQLSSLPGLLVVAVLFGLGYGGVIPSYAIIIRELIPARMVGSALGMVFFFGNLGMSLGGYLGGLIYDLSGGYTLSYATGALAGGVNLVIVGALLLTVRAGPRQPPAPAPAVA